MSGPKANPRIYTDTTKAAKLSLVVPKSFMTSGTPGAKKEDARGVSRVSVERTAMLAHLRDAGLESVSILKCTT